MWLCEFKHEGENHGRISNDDKLMHTLYVSLERENLMATATTKKKMTFNNKKKKKRKSQPSHTTPVDSRVLFFFFFYLVPQSDQVHHHRTTLYTLCVSFFLLPIVARIVSPHFYVFYFILFILYFVCLVLKALGKFEKKPVSLL